MIPPASFWLLWMLIKLKTKQNKTTCEKSKQHHFFDRLVFWNVFVDLNLNRRQNILLKHSDDWIDNSTDRKQRSTKKKRDTVKKCTRVICHLLDRVDIFPSGTSKPTAKMTTKSTTKSTTRSSSPEKLSLSTWILTPHQPNPASTQSQQATSESYWFFTV